MEWCGCWIQGTLSIKKRIWIQAPNNCRIQNALRTMKLKTHYYSFLNQWCLQRQTMEQERHLRCWALEWRVLSAQIKSQRCSSTIVPNCVVSYSPVGWRGQGWTSSSAEKDPFLSRLKETLQIQLVLLQPPPLHILHHERKARPRPAWPTYHIPQTELRKRLWHFILGSFQFFTSLPLFSFLTKSKDLLESRNCQWKPTIQNTWLWMSPHSQG